MLTLLLQINVDALQSLPALCQLVRHSLAGFKPGDARRLDCGLKNEIGRMSQIIFDKAKALIMIELFNNAGSHYFSKPS